MIWLYIFGGLMVLVVLWAGVVLYSMGHNNKEWTDFLD